MNDLEQAAIVQNLKRLCSPADTITTAADAARDLKDRESGMGFSGIANVLPRHYDLIIVVPREDGTIGKPTHELIERAVSYGRRAVLYRLADDGRPVLTNFVIAPTGDKRYFKVSPA